MAGKTALLISGFQERVLLAIRTEEREATRKEILTHLSEQLDGLPNNLRGKAQRRIRTFFLREWLVKRALRKLEKKKLVEELSYKRGGQFTFRLTAGGRNYLQKVRLVAKPEHMPELLANAENELNG